MQRDMNTGLIIAFLTFALACALVIFISSKSRKEVEALRRTMQADIDREKEQNSNLQSENSRLQAELKAKEELEARLKEQREAAEKNARELHEKELEDARAQREKDLQLAREQREQELKLLREQFANLSNQTSDAFRAKSEKTISDLLKPVQDKFKEFNEAMQKTQQDATERHAKLEQKIVDLDTQSKSIGDEARNLANALTGYSKVQGDFGEMLLTDVLKNAGMLEGIHFLTQSVMTNSANHEIKDENGRTLIPDVMVLYPDETAVIIDSKVSLTDYQKFMTATTLEEREKFAKAHIDSVRKHIEELSKKDYASYLPAGKKKVNYNIMFIPMEGAFRLMLEKEPMLWQLAKDRNVLVVSQMTLVIVLNMIQMAWKQYEQEQNIQQVYKTGEELMSQLRSWLEQFVKVGNSIASAQKSYDEAMGKLSTSQQSALRKGESILGNIRKLECMGLEPKKSKAKIKTGARIIGTGSIIPDVLLPAPESVAPGESDVVEEHGE